jgi:DME family drug/metabolite transporter
MACVVSIARLAQARPVEAIQVTGWIAIMGLGLTTALSRLTMFSALERLGGVETSIAGPLELLVSLVLALLMLGERLATVQWIGGALLMLSLWLMSRDRGMHLAEGNVPLEWRQK